MLSMKKFEKKITSKCAYGPPTLVPNGTIFGHHELKFKKKIDIFGPISEATTTPFLESCVTLTDRNMDKRCEKGHFPELIIVARVIRYKVQ